MDAKTHSEIVEVMEGQLRAMPAGPVTAQSLAVIALQVWLQADTERHIEHGAREHFKQIARGVLAGRYGKGRKAAHREEQLPLNDELFGDSLQERYPRKHQRDEEPAYVPIGMASDADLWWNVEQMRSASGGLLRHVDALVVYIETRAAQRGGEAA